MPEHPTPNDGIRFSLNGQSCEATGFALSTTLLDFVRERGFTGSKEGCAEGECGACTVLLVMGRGEKSSFTPVNSCLVPLAASAGQEIYTVEALCEGGVLAEVQQAMIEQGGSQCGYCTPGFVVSMFAEQYRAGRTGPCDPRALSGNLCRCTGYRPIRDAAASVGPAPAGAFRDRMELPAPRLGTVNYRERYFRPGDLAECLELLGAYPDARMIAGGTDLMVESNLRDRRFPVLIGVDGLPELRVFQESGDAVVIGAGLTLSEIGEKWRGAPGVLHDWLELFASPLIRNRATLGGNLATASPIGDSAPLLLALDASVQIAGPEGVRSVPLSEFFQGYRQTALTSRDVLVSVTVPQSVGEDVRFYKIAKRRSDDISTVAAGISISLDSAGRVARTRLAYGGVAATPVRAVEAENALLGRKWDLAAVALAQEKLAGNLTPLSDHRGSARYRLAIAQSVIAKYFHEQRIEAAA